MTQRFFGKARVKKIRAVQGTVVRDARTDQGSNVNDSDIKLVHIFKALNIFKVLRTACRRYATADGRGRALPAPALVLEGGSGTTFVSRSGRHLLGDPLDFNGPFFSTPPHRENHFPFFIATRGK